MKEFIVWFTGTMSVSVDEANVSGDENIKDLAIEKLYDRIWETPVEIMSVGSVEEV